MVLNHLPYIPKAKLLKLNSLFYYFLQSYMVCESGINIYIDQQHEKYFTITPFNILHALKNIKYGKSSGVDGISPQNTLYLLMVTFMIYYPCFCIYYIGLYTKCVHEMRKVRLFGCT